ncbi:hypothetical protein E5676_scaffold1213G00020 [Cucumis melo var. makuwa]|uniref:Uncharacterized protein n=1 Tax=Cucumis melo var. makuwa TaxID=1194695 RepID=A0A5D3DW38_CUCMM|nr:hypothetical protein E6C27_scaffold381G00020 [Cucumis melo var. makuwa]TYK27505.1 hypothetical protein E5676_scaffold1213G00020 [Cucumis melo var. makuwa]
MSCMIVPNNPDIYPDQGLIVDPREGDANKIIKLISLPGATWTRTPAKSLQLFRHQLTTDSNEWLFFIKKKILPTHHDNTIPIEYALLSYCIMAKQPFNLGYVMNEAFLG